MTSTEWTHKTATVRVTLPAHTSRPPGRGATWAAEVGKHDKHRVTGATERAAVTALAEGLAEFITEYRPPVVNSYNGYTSILAIEPSDGAASWREVIVSPGGIICSSSSCNGGWDRAEARARYGLVQRTTDWVDDESVHAGARYIDAGRHARHDTFNADEHYRYAAWQRAAAHAVDAGIPNMHEWATEHQNEFTITRPGKG